MYFCTYVFMFLCMCICMSCVCICVCVCIFSYDFKTCLNQFQAPSIFRFLLGQPFKTSKERSIQPQNRGHCEKVAPNGRYAAGAQSGLRPSRGVTTAVQRCAKDCGFCICHTHRRIYTHTIHVHRYTCTYTYTNERTHTYVHVYIHIFIYTQYYKNIYVYVIIYIFIYIHRYININIYIHFYAHT